MITSPGVYDIDNDTYQADPVEGGSLPHSGARMLLPPSCPAVFHHWQSNPRPSTDAFDFGHVAHDMVLGGKGPRITVVDADDWRTKRSQDERKAAKAEGAVAILRDDYRQIELMAEAIRRHPLASALFAPGSGTPEATLVWPDCASNGQLVNRRARLDWLPNPRPSGRIVIPDYKTADTANPDRFARSAADYGYHQQHAYYTDGVTALELGDDPAFLFVVQEKRPPYLVSVVELDIEAVRIGRELNRRAIDTYAECKATDTWPGYTTDVALVGLPYWYLKRFEDTL